MADWLDKALSVTDTIGSIAGGVLKFTNSANEVATFLNGVKFVARFVPALSTVVAVMDAAEPILQKIAIAAPLVRKAVEAGRPIMEAIQTHGPAVLAPTKELLALAINADPARTETSITPADISDQEAAEFAATTIFEASFFSPQDPRFDRVHIG